jgi:hypothetical protein
MLVLRPDHAGAAALQDAGLFRRDPRQILPEELGMVVAHRAITEASGAAITLVASTRPPRPDFQQAEIGRVVGIEVKRDRRRHLEKGDRLSAIALWICRSHRSASRHRHSPPGPAPSLIRSLKRTRCGDV